jgi:hypothetical protein
MFFIFEVPLDVMSVRWQTVFSLLFSVILIQMVQIGYTPAQAQSYGCAPDCPTETLEQAIAQARASAHNTNSTSSQATKLSESESCSSKMTDEENTIASSLNQSKAVSLVENSDEFKSIIQRYNITPPVMFEEWTLNSTTCSVTLKDVNVGSQLSNSTGYAKTMQVTLDPSLTKILNLVVRDAVTYDVGSQNTILASPLKQFKNGVSINDIKCETGLVLASKKSDGSPACVEMQTAQKLVERGWAKEIVFNTTQNATLPASFMPCDTPYPVNTNGYPTNVSFSVMYMPMNSIGKLCVRYSTYPNQPVPVGIQIFEANATDENQNATEITLSASPNMIPGGADTTVVYTIKTGNYSGFYGLRLFCDGMPFAVGYDSDSIKPSDFAGIVNFPYCPAQGFGFHIAGLTGIDIKKYNK